MIRDITIGQFYPVESKIHALDARTKIVSTFIYIFAIFLANTYIAYIPILLFLSLVIYTSKVPLKFMLKGLKSILFIILFTVVINVFMATGDKVLFEYGFIKVTIEGLYLSGIMALRLIFLIVGSSILTLTTSPIQLTDGIEVLMKPLKKIGVPAHEIAMMMTIALRFIPTLLEETDKIMKAQSARGADFETGNIIKRAKSMVPILVPLFISAFRRADDLAMAMEARCYHGDIGRTRMKQMRMYKNDYVTFAVMFVFVLVLIFLRR
jgi:energy-coupling factor transport system permease protein